MVSELLIKALLSVLIFSSMVTLTFALFRIPLLEHHRIITLLGITLGVINFYVRFIAQSSLYPIIVLVVFIVLLMVLKRYPFFYTFIVCSMGTLVGTILTDGLVAVFFTQLNIINFNTIQDSIIAYSLVSSCVLFFNILIIYFLRKFNMGFSFIIKRFKTKQALKGSNFIWAGLIIIGVIISQFAIENMEILTLQVYMVTGISVVLLIILFIAYRQNKKSIKDRFGR